MLKRSQRPIRIAIALSLAWGASAAPVNNLQDAAQRAIVNNPDIQSRWHTFQATAAQQDAAFGGYLPQVDVAASGTREKLTQPGFLGVPYTSSFRHPLTSISLRQVLFDGFATRNAVREFRYAKLSSYYDLLSTTDDVTLQVVQAYLDVQRYHKLAELARDNYATHKGIFDQIEQKVKAGAGRRVDLEQAAGRLALAESNWMTDAANLHDVQSRFQRLVGDLPADALMDMPDLDAALPNVAHALPDAVNQNPALLSALETIRSARAGVAARKSAYSPTVSLEASQTVEHNQSGVMGRQSTGIVGVVLNYNLFNGGTDSAHIREQAERLNGAMDQRDKVCRDLRQTVAIALNDVQRIKAQHGYLEQHQLSTEKARDAYRKQFDIGQRTLLDLLDTENELFDARRATVNADYDLPLAQARVLAATHNLLPALKLAPLTDSAPSDAQDDPLGDEGRAKCDTQLPTPSSIDPASVVPKPYIAFSAPVEPVLAAPAALDVTPAVKRVIDSWVAAWSKADVPRYLALYSPAFKSDDGRGLAQWRVLRSGRISHAGPIDLKLDKLKITQVDATHAQAAFEQDYRAKTQHDLTAKTLDLALEDGKWLIVGEHAMPAGSTPAAH